MLPFVNLSLSRLYTLERYLWNKLVTISRGANKIKFIFFLNGGGDYHNFLLLIKKNNNNNAYAPLVQGQLRYLE